MLMAMMAAMIDGGVRKPAGGAEALGMLMFLV